MRAFNNDWHFHRGDTQGAEAIDFDDSSWRTLDVPHDWSIEDLPIAADETRGAIWTDGTNPMHTGPFDMYASEGQISTGWTVGGIGWYRKTFNGPEVPRGCKAELRFEGVYMNCDVWLNGVHLGTHPYGYTEISFDVTAHLIGRPQYRRAQGEQHRPQQPVVLGFRHLSQGMAHRRGRVANSRARRIRDDS